MSRHPLLLFAAAALAAGVAQAQTQPQSTADAPQVQLPPGQPAAAPVENRIHTSSNGPTVAVPVRRGVKVQEPIVSAPVASAAPNPPAGGDEPAR